jgi:acetyl/propionyl-CoA carboxylase alpha subunit
VQTDAGFLRWLVDDPAFVSGEYDTGLVADRWRPGATIDPVTASLAATAALEARGMANAPGRPVAPAVARDSAWGRAARRDGLRR